MEPIGKTGKTWNKVTPEDVAYWTRLVEIDNMTYREVGRLVGRDHSVIRNRINVKPKPVTKTPEQLQAQRDYYRRTLDGTIYSLVTGARRRSQQRGCAFTLNAPMMRTMYEAQAGRCAVTGVAFDLTPRPIKSRTNPYAPSIDRIDTQGGYTIDNVRLVLYAVNTAMGDWGEDVFASIARAFILHRGPF